MKHQKVLIHEGCVLTMILIITQWLTIVEEEPSTQASLQTTISCYPRSHRQQVSITQGTFLISLQWVPQKEITLRLTMMTF